MSKRRSCCCPQLLKRSCRLQPLLENKSCRRRVLLEKIPRLPLAPKVSRPAASACHFLQKLRPLERPCCLRLLVGNGPAVSVRLLKRRLCCEPQLVEKADPHIC